MVFEMTREQLAYLLIIAVILLTRKLWQWRREAIAEQDERDAKYIVERLTGWRDEPRKHVNCRCSTDFRNEIDAMRFTAAAIRRQVHVEQQVREVLDGIPGFDAYFNRPRKPFDPRKGKSNKERGHDV